MDMLDQLTKKVQQAAHEIINLKKEKTQLLSELELLRQEVQHYQHTIRENELALKTYGRVRSKLEKISKKLEKSMTNEQSVGLVLEGSNHE
jgi:hypothetical protein